MVCIGLILLVSTTAVFVCPKCSSSCLDNPVHSQSAHVNNAVVIFC